MIIHLENSQINCKCSLESHEDYIRRKTILDEMIQINTYNNRENRVSDKERYIPACLASNAAVKLEIRT